LASAGAGADAGGVGSGDFAGPLRPDFRSAGDPDSPDGAFEACASLDGAGVSGESAFSDEDSPAGLGAPVALLPADDASVEASPLSDGCLGWPPSAASASEAVDCADGCPDSAEADAPGFAPIPADDA
jgi:hypothetical protein